MRGHIPAANLPNDLHFLLDGAAPFESIEGCSVFHLFRKCYTAYLVTEGCEGSGGQYDDETFEGDKLCRYVHRTQVIRVEISYKKRRAA